VFAFSKVICDHGKVRNEDSKLDRRTADEGIFWRCLKHGCPGRIKLCLSRWPVFQSKARRQQMCI